MLDIRAIISSLIQVISIIIVALLLRNHDHRSSISYGVIVTLSIFTLLDALPYLVIKQRGFLYNPKYHHSSAGIIGFILLGLYRLLLFMWDSKMKYFQNIVEKIEIKILGFNVNLFYFFIGVGLTSTLTQLHEIIYFGTLKFPDRGYPYDLRLWELIK